MCGYQGPQITLHFQGTWKSAAKSSRAVHEGNADLGFECGAQSWRSPKGTSGLMTALSFGMEGGSTKKHMGCCAGRGT